MRVSRLAWRVSAGIPASVRPGALAFFRRSRGSLKGILWGSLKGILWGFLKGILWGFLKGILWGFLNGSVKEYTLGFLHGSYNGVAVHVGIHRSCSNLNPEPKTVIN